MSAMGRRIDLGELPAELRMPEAAPCLLAYLDLVRARQDDVACCRQYGGENMTLLDLLICQHILAFELLWGGTRQSTVVDSIAAPRRTVRDGLERLERSGVICRDGGGTYHPTDAMIPVVDHIFEVHFRLVGRLSETYQAWRAAIRRNTP